VYLTGLMHRDELFDITLRWLNDELHEDDGRIISEIFLYESAVSTSEVLDLMLRFFQRLYGVGLAVERVQHKHILRERLIQCNPTPTERVDTLAREYLSNPEFFFPRLPVDAVLLFAPEQRLVSISRIKRMARVAEKASFRMADALAGKVRGEAEKLAALRASALGLPLASMISTEPEMKQDFVVAELAIANGFRNRAVALERSALAINDIIGFKIIGEQEELDRAQAELAQEPGVTIVESQKHTGRYNATNLQVDIELPPVGQLVDDLRDLDWSIAAQRGLDPTEVRRNFPTFVEQGARSVRTEVILTTYPELLESELGRSLHELRILTLRERNSYSGPIAENARYLIEYLLAVAYAPTVHVPELPIKMWGRYLPETLAGAMRSLYGIETDGILLRTFTTNSGQMRGS
jgi:hypothetical protein